MTQSSLMQQNSNSRNGNMNILDSAYKYGGANSITTSKEYAYGNAHGTMDLPR
jgi:hypothetical protein